MNSNDLKKRVILKEKTTELLETVKTISDTLKSLHIPELPVKISQTSQTPNRALNAANDYKEASMPGINIPLMDSSKSKPEITQNPNSIFLENFSFKDEEHANSTLPHLPNLNASNTDNQGHTDKKITALEAEIERLKTFELKFNDIQASKPDSSGPAESQTFIDLKQKTLENFNSFYNTLNFKRHSPASSLAENLCNKLKTVTQNICHDSAMQCIMDSVSIAEEAIKFIMDENENIEIRVENIAKQSQSIKEETRIVITDIEENHKKEKSYYDTKINDLKAIITSLEFELQKYKLNPLNSTEKNVNFENSEFINLLNENAEADNFNIPSGNIQLKQPQIQLQQTIDELKSEHMTKINDLKTIITSLEFELKKDRLNPLKSTERNVYFEIPEFINLLNEKAEADNFNIPSGNIQLNQTQIHIQQTIDELKSEHMTKINDLKAIITSLEFELKKYKLNQLNSTEKNVNCENSEFINLLNENTETDNFNIPSGNIQLNQTQIHIQQTIDELKSEHMTKINDLKAIITSLEFELKKDRLNPLDSTERNVNCENSEFINLLNEKAEADNFNYEAIAYENIQLNQTQIHIQQTIDELKSEHMTKINDLKAIITSLEFELQKYKLNPLNSTERNVYFENSEFINLLNENAETDNFNIEIIAYENIQLKQNQIQLQQTINEWKSEHMVLKQELKEAFEQIRISELNACELEEKLRQSEISLSKERLDFSKAEELIKCLEKQCQENINHEKNQSNILKLSMEDEIRNGFKLIHENQATTEELLKLEKSLSNMNYKSKLIAHENLELKERINNLKAVISKKELEWSSTFDIAQKESEIVNIRFKEFSSILNNYDGQFQAVIALSRCFSECPEIILNGHPHQFAEGFSFLHGIYNNLNNQHRELIQYKNRLEVELQELKKEASNLMKTTELTNHKNNELTTRINELNKGKEMLIEEMKQVEERAKLAEERCIKRQSRMNNILAVYKNTF